MKFIPLFLSSLIFLSCVTGCSNKSNDNDYSSDPKLIYYTIGNKDKDLELVNDEINKFLSSKYNFTIEYNKVSWTNYNDVINSVIASNNFDIAFASSKSQGDFVTNAQKGLWLNLTPYLQNQAKKLYETIDSRFWKGVTIDEKIYGIPTNKELAVLEYFIFSKDLVEKYDIDISQYKTVESLAPILNLIKSNEPDYTPFTLDSDIKNYFSYYGYEFVLDSKIPIMINSFDENLSLVNIFETDVAKNTLNTLRKYYQLGYINSDCAIKEVTDTTPTEKLFCTISSGGPYSEITWSQNWNTEVISNPISPPIITNQSVSGGIMTVNARTKYPKECVQFLELLNTNYDFRNLINYGIKDIHYKLSDKGQVEIISNRYAGVPHTQGNFFILNTTTKEPLNKWQEYKNFNSKCIESPLLGFIPDLSNITNEIENISKVCDYYYPSLATGSVNPNIFLPRFIDDLKSMGIDKVQTELQKQINDWKVKK